MEGVDFWWVSGVMMGGDGRKRRWRGVWFEGGREGTGREVCLQNIVMGSLGREGHAM